jgi:Kef-type K+ transport system membrane component KefB
VDSGTLGTLTVILAVAVLAPFLAELLKRFRVSAVVIEILAGIVVGPQLLGLGQLDPTIQSISSLGLAFLMFLAGYEVDFARIKGTPLKLATKGWLFSLVLGLAIGFLLQEEGKAVSGLIIGLILTTTALGTMLPMWRDAGLLRGRFGTHLLAVGTLGEFGPIVAIALLLSGHRPRQASLLLVLFVIVAVGTAMVAAQPKRPRLVRILQANLNTSAQLPVRVSVLLIVVLLWIANSLGLDVLLGAFTAGIVVRLGIKGPDENVIRIKLEAIGFGFFIPIFFVVSGMQFDLDGLVSTTRSLVILPAALGLFLLIRGLPVFLFYRDELEPDERWPFALFSAAGLPLIVAISQIGVVTGRLAPPSAAALVGAGILSVTIYPLIAFSLLQRQSPKAAEPAEPSDGREKPAGQETTSDGTA